ncbi:hypothetical protein [Streptosporangium sp. KLBMP 9127]|nr:hypothetical protein [Streptosporangium sp. KLBMP 9127]
MPNLGPVELIILLIIILAVVTMIAAAAGRRNRSRAPSAGPPRIPGDLQERARLLMEQKKVISAVKLIREETGLDLKDAKFVADAIAAGRAVPIDTAGPADSSTLADRARALKISGREEQAIFLVRGETGMNHPEAFAFVQSLQPETDAL